MASDAIIQLVDMQERGVLRPDSEDALALAFAEQYANELRYVHLWGRWFRYNGTRWSHDDTLHVFENVSDFVDRLRRCDARRAELVYTMRYDVLACTGRQQSLTCNGRKILWFRPF